MSQKWDNLMINIANFFLRRMSKHAQAGLRTVITYGMRYAPKKEDQE